MHVGVFPIKSNAPEWKPPVAKVFSPAARLHNEERRRGLTGVGIPDVICRDGFELSVEVDTNTVQNGAVQIIELFHDLACN